MGLRVHHVELGSVVVDCDAENRLDEIGTALAASGFDLLHDRKAQLAENIKTLLITYIHYPGSNPHLPVNISDYLSESLQTDYHYLSTLFSKQEGITIEKYVILQKIERAKELLSYGELTISEIAYQLGYSSVHHLSNQFKKVTGLTPSQFKTTQTNGRLPLDKVGR